MPSFMAIGSGVLLPGVAENPPFPIFRALAYTTGLDYRPTCENWSTEATCRRGEETKKTKKPSHKQ